MITLAFEQALFAALRAGFECAVRSDAPPISAPQLGRIRPALAAGAAAARRGRPILVRLESAADLYALGDCSVAPDNH